LEVEFQPEIQQKRSLQQEKSVFLRAWASPPLNFACYLEVLCLLWQDGVTDRYIAYQSSLSLPLSPILLCGNLLSSVGVDQLLW